MLCEKFFPVDAVNNPAALKNCLDSLTAGYDGRFLDSDPAAIVHRYASPSDIEVAGFVVSSLAYGNAAQIRKSADDIFARIGTAPSWFARDLAPERALSDKAAMIPYVRLRALWQTLKKISSVVQ